MPDHITLTIEELRALVGDDDQDANKIVLALLLLATEVRSLRRIIETAAGAGHAERGL